MAVKRLTKRALDSYRPEPGSREVLWDVDVRGFGVRPTPTGGKVFVVRYRLPGLGRSSHQRWLTLGDYGSITVDQARTLARKALADVARGLDPASERRARRDAPSVAELGVAFLAHVQAHRKPTTSYEYARLWRKHVLPTFGTRKVADVTTAEIRRMQLTLRETPYLANRCLALVGAFFSFAERDGVRAAHTNPTRDLDRYAERGRERFLAPEERIRLGQAIETAERRGLPPAPEHRSRKDVRENGSQGDGAPKPAYGFAIAALRLLYFTGCREGEILTLRWADVDLQGGFLRLQDTKTGTSVRPLNAPAREVLANLPRIAGSPFVFPSPVLTDAPLREIRRLWCAVRHAAGLADVRLHDFRHTTASVLAAGGASLLEIGAVLGHRTTAATKRYTHLVENHIKSWSERAGEELRAGLVGNHTTVTPLRRGAER